MRYQEARDEALRCACGVVNAFYSAIAEENERPEDEGKADDLYYEAIEVLSRLFGQTDSFFEDTCMFVRERGWDND